MLFTFPSPSFVYNFLHREFLLSRLSTIYPQFIHNIHSMWISACGLFSWSVDKYQKALPRLFYFDKLNVHKLVDELSVITRYTQAVDNCYPHHQHRVDNFIHSFCSLWIILVCTIE